MRKRLRLARDEGLGLATIMNDELAAQYGVSYVHLAAFDIDIDRVYWLDPDSDVLPFGWEVFLTEQRLLSLIDPEKPSERAMIASICAAVLEDNPGDAPLGAQIVFATYDAVTPGKLDREIAKLFLTWRRPPEDLTLSLAELWANEGDRTKQLVSHCLRSRSSRRWLQRRGKRSRRCARAANSWLSERSRGGPLRFVEIS